MAGVKATDWALECKGTTEVESVASASGVRPTNDLGGLIRKKKRKADDDKVSEGVVSQVENAGQTDAGVNVLIGRKKAKS